MNLIKNLAEHLEGDKAIDHAELTKFNAKLENIRLAACALSDLLQRINSPARGDAAQIEWMFKELDNITGMRDTPESAIHGTFVSISSSAAMYMPYEEAQRRRLHKNMTDGKYYVLPEEAPESGSTIPREPNDPTHASDSIGYAMLRTMVSREQLEEKYPKEPPRHCNFCWKETGTKDGDCVDCGFSKVPKQATPIHFDYGEMEQGVAAEKFDPKKWLGGDK